MKWIGCGNSLERIRGDWGRSFREFGDGNGDGEWEGGRCAGTVLYQVACCVPETAGNANTAREEVSLVGCVCLGLA
jgi:hypothetical protein